MGAGAILFARLWWTAGYLFQADAPSPWCGVYLLASIAMFPATLMAFIWTIVAFRSIVQGQGRGPKPYRNERFYP
jgi:hypothetical protein